MPVTRRIVPGLLAVFALAVLAACGSDSVASEPTEPGAAPATVPVLSDAGFELVNTQQWLNSEPVSIGELNSRGQVVLVDFWTYTCINCINTFPALRAWHDRYADHGLTVLGVHTPEFKFEREFANLSEAVEEHDLRYPIVQDNEYATWRAFKNRYWPATYIIDPDGRLRHTHFGEGGYSETESIIRSLLSEAGHDVDGIEAAFGDA